MNSDKAVNPKISVIMGIYNCEDTLEDAIESILAQTYKNWELIMCDDGSGDRTYEIARQYLKAYSGKIILLKNEKNKGLNHTLNRCLDMATGDYIARMDADDMCSKERFAEEVAILQNEPDIAIVSTDMLYFDESGIWGKISHPLYPQKKDFVHGTPFCHAPCMVRKEAYDTVNGYTEEKKLLRVEDYHLWIKMYSKGFRGKNIQKPLYRMRDDRNAYSRRKFKYRLNEAYVRKYAVTELKLGFFNYIYVLRPILVGLMPNVLYDLLHKGRLRG